MSGMEAEHCGSADQGEKQESLEQAANKGRTDVTIFVTIGNFRPLSTLPLHRFNAPFSAYFWLSICIAHSNLSVHF